MAIHWLFVAHKAEVLLPGMTSSGVDNCPHGGLNNQNS
jgi:hypothetical protein